MTYDTMFWILLGSAFVMTGVVGAGWMWKTEKLLVSFLAATAIDVLITGGAVWWWGSVFSGMEQHFSRWFGIFGLVISFVNNEILLLFALLSMKKKIVGGGRVIVESPDDYQ